MLGEHALDGTLVGQVPSALESYPALPENGLECKSGPVGVLGMGIPGAAGVRNEVG